MHSPTTATSEQHRTVRTVVQMTLEARRVSNRTSKRTATRYDMTDRGMVVLESALRAPQTHSFVPPSSHLR
jgi:hypothetical protein